MRIVDSHVHVWSPERRTAEPEPGAVLPEVDATAERLIELMDANGVARAIVVQHSAFARDDRYLEQVLAAHPTRLAGMATLPVQPTAADAEAATAKLGRGSIRGARLVLLQPAALSLLAEGGFGALLSRATDTGQVISILTRGSAGLAAADALARDHTGLRLVIDHMAHVVSPEGVAAYRLARLLALAVHDGVHVKLALHHQFSAQPYPWADLIEVQQQILGAFGARRCLWGSNFPMFMPQLSYPQRLEVLSKYFPFADDEARAWVMGGTAETLWPG